RLGQFLTGDSVKNSPALTHGNRYIILFQKKFHYLEKKFGIKVSAAIRNRKADFILMNTDKGRVVNIEVNFYSGTGSKPQEIVDSYINRQEELKEISFLGPEVTLIRNIITFPVPIIIGLLARHINPEKLGGAFFTKEGGEL
ncbi:MAG TPA: DpnII family type II restriction endonuclease, partial [Bacillota bacterium]|nr:DpnII family type II restriction endonuclease [Bacillota bacterium]